MPRAVRALRTASARPIFVAASLALLGACGRPSAADSGLNDDLVLAGQLQQRNAPAVAVAQDTAPAAPTVAAAPARTTVREIVRTRVGMHAVARRVVADPAASAGAPAPTHADARVGGYDPGHASSGEVVAAGPTADGGAPVPGGTYGAGSYGSTSGTSTPVYQQPQAHAERDAIVGTVAGAIIGAVTGHGARGALIGAAAGGALGAVYGGSVDRTYPGYGAGYPTYAGVRNARSSRTLSGFRVPTYRPY